jgi:hypothetical protein
MAAEPTLRRSPGLRRLALLASTLLACTTVRTSVSTIGESVRIRDGHAEPQLELWVESSRQLSRAEAEQARGAARAALAQALAGRAEPEGDSLLVVRAQGVSRTAGRRGDQTAATAGIAIGAVAVVAATVVAVVALGGGGGGGHHSSGGFRGGGHGVPGRGGGSVAAAAGGAARGHGGSVAGAVTAAARPRGFPVVHAPGPAGFRGHGFPVVPAPGAPLWVGQPWHPWHHHHPGPILLLDVDVGYWWTFPVAPGPWGPYDEVAPAPLPPYLPPPAGDEPEELADDQAPALPLQAPDLEDLQLSPPPPLPLAGRGYFDGDVMVLDAVVVDRTSGETLWVKRVSRAADLRDPAAVRSAMDALLSGEGWMPPAEADRG